MSKLTAKWNKFLCRWRGHVWDDQTEQFKRRCVCCDQREYLAWNRYPDIGEPAYEWVKP